MFDKAEFIVQKNKLLNKSILKNKIFKTVNDNKNIDFNEPNDELLEIYTRIAFAVTNKTIAYIPSLGDQYTDMIFANNVKISNLNLEFIGIENTNKKSIIIDGSKIQTGSWYNQISGITYFGFEINKVRVYCYMNDYTSLNRNINNFNFSSLYSNSIVTCTKTYKGQEIRNSMNFENLISENIKYKNYLTKTNIHLKLSGVDFLIIELPIIMWRIGWINAAYTMAHWVYNTKNYNENLKWDFEWIYKYNRVKEAVSMKINQLNSSLTNEISDIFVTFKKNYEIGLVNAIKEMKTTEVVKLYGHFNPLTEYRLSKNLGAKNVFDTTTIGGYYIYGYYFTDDDLTATMGNFRISFYGKFEIKRTNEEKKFAIKLINIGYRAGDNFDFPEDQFLGYWQHLIQKPKKPDKLNIKNEDFEYKLNDKIFREFYQKSHDLKPEDKGEDGILTNNDFFAYSNFKYFNNEEVNNKIFYVTLD